MSSEPISSVVFVTESATDDHSTSMTAAALPRVAASRVRAESPGVDVAQVYDQHADFIWRALRHLGVPPDLVDDALQEVFIVVHRRLIDFEGRSSLRTWLYGIALRIAREYRRRYHLAKTQPLSELIADDRPSPVELLAGREASEVLAELLERLPEDQREVFVLKEIEDLSAPEIAEALELKLNTVYSRLRLARRAFDQALARYQALEARRSS